MSLLAQKYEKEGRDSNRTGVLGFRQQIRDTFAPLSGTNCHHHRLFARSTDQRQRVVVDALEMTPSLVAWTMPTMLLPVVPQHFGRSAGRARSYGRR
jgi:hypothetical protein